MIGIVIKLKEREWEIDWFEVVTFQEGRREKRIFKRESENYFVQRWNACRTFLFLKLALAKHSHCLNLSAPSFLLFPVSSGSSNSSSLWTWCVWVWQHDYLNFTFSNPNWARPCQWHGPHGYLEASSAYSGLLLNVG